MGHPGHEGASAWGMPSDGEFAIIQANGVTFRFNSLTGETWLYDTSGGNPRWWPIAEPPTPGPGQTATPPAGS